MRFVAQSPSHFLKALLGSLVIMIVLIGQAESMQAAMLGAQLSRLVSISQQAEAAAQKGDLEGVKAAFGQIESINNSPYPLVRGNVSKPEVQQILQRTIQVLAEAHLKSAEEAQRSGDVENSKSSLKQMEGTLQNLPVFITGPVALPEYAQKRAAVLIKNISGKADEEARQKEEYEKQALEMAAREREKEEAIQKRLAELAEENRRDAIRRKAQQSKVRPNEPTDHDHSYQEGQSLASSLMGGITPSNPAIVPGYAGAEVPQSQIRAHDLGEEATKASHNNEASELLRTSFEKGEKFVIDPHTDPLIMAGNEIVGNPQKVLDETIVEGGGGVDATEEVKTCEEGGEEYIQKCSKRLEIVLKVIPEVWGSQRYCSGVHKSWWPYTVDDCTGWNFGGCASYPVLISAEKVEVAREEWIDDCAVLEDLTEKGLCRYVSKSISQKDETRTIEGKPITRDHFEEYLEYACLKASAKSCAGLREKGCYQVKSVCKEEIDGRCVLWEQTYNCPSGKAFGKSYRSSGGKNPFCLSGDCADKSYDPNQDFGQVMSQMSVLKEAGDDLKNFGSIFKGLDWRCTRHCIGFKDCCGNGNGWGISLNLASCDKMEQTLAELRAKKRCIQVGTYCAEKELGVCIRKKTTFCCYDTKLARIVQEQGKRQLGLGFGSPEQPQCQGLTIEQLAQLDFSKIDFSDMLADIMASTRTPNPDKMMSGIQRSMQDRGTLLKVKEKVGDQSIGVPQLNDESPKTAPEGMKKSNIPSPPLQPKVIDKQVRANTPITKSPQDHQIQGRSHGQF